MAINTRCCCFLWPYLTAWVYVFIELKRFFHANLWTSSNFSFVVMFIILPETEDRSLEAIELHFSDNSKGLTDIHIPKNRNQINENDENSWRLECLPFFSVPNYGYIDIRYIDIFPNWKCLKLYLNCRIFQWLCHCGILVCFNLMNSIKCLSKRLIVLTWHICARLQLIHASANNRTTIRKWNEYMDCSQ